MDTNIKPDAQDIVEHIKNLKKQTWLSESQKWWPDHLFHFTDIENAVKILTDGALYSRTELLITGRLSTDIASPNVIASTATQWKNYVRLYFRPRTPTQYCNEGFRPINQLKLGGAHCPVPIIFIFEAKQILIQKGTLFSDGNLAAGANVGGTAVFLSSIPFEKVYHDRYLTEADRANIKFHRHAEVIVPTSLNLSSLKFILCRNQAEFETLLHLMPVTVFDKWQHKVSVDTKLKLFFSKWSFILKADISTSEISFTFNPFSLTPGPFKAKMEILEEATNIVYSWEKKVFYTDAEAPLSFSLSKMTHSEQYEVSFWLDEKLAYKNIFMDDSEIPF